jgi:GTP pyrophosphokinase
MAMTDKEKLPLEQQEDEQIDAAFHALLDSYLASPHRKKVDIITRAFTFARQAHKGVRRHSGEPYILHPLAVARIVSEEIGLGSTSICAALLHDVVEDTDYTVEDIRNLFGDKIALIVEGLTKIAGGIFGGQASVQAENFKKLLLTMSEDIRVILIKIADRLHNMRTLSSMRVDKQYKIAGETLYIYAPLAYRLGLNKIKSELENLSFRYEHPEEYARIDNKLKETKEQLYTLYDNFTTPIREKLDAMGFKYTLTGRIKSPYSIWKKMQNKHLTFEEIYDILAVRIVFEPKDIRHEVNECFDIYVALSKIYNVHPDRIRDWVNQPKTNGYQALHITLMSHHGEWVEVQIRSRRMDDIAEQGVAAHWKYKAEERLEHAAAGKALVHEEDDGELDKWLRTIKEILDDPQPDAMDFLDAIKLNLYASEIFVFTPKGDIRTMPQGSTALDFAFTIHTMVGTHCIGAKVNHKLVPLSYQLRSGDQVEVLTSRTQQVNPAWLNIVTTAKARSKIQASLRREQRMLRKDGEAIFNEFVEKEDLTVDDNAIARIAALHGLENREQLFMAIGRKSIVLGDPEKSVIKGNGGIAGLFKRKPKVPNKTDDTSKREVGEVFDIKNIDRKKPLILTDELIRTRYHLATCCNPIAGDDVLGYIDHDGKIIIHKRNCSVATKLKAGFGNRILSATWSTHKEHLFSATVALRGIDSLGVLNKITVIISQKLNANIEKIMIEAHEGIFEGEITLRVYDVDDIQYIISDLKKVKEISYVARKK